MNERRAGVRMPAEWEPHDATWLVWPHNRDDWGVKTATVEWCYVDMIRHLIRGERVALVCQDARLRARALDRLGRSGVDTARVDIHVVPTNRSWIRDSGPIFVVRGRGARRTVVATDWRFTGWSRYRAHQLDDALPRAIALRLGMDRIDVRAGEARVVLEGGSIDVNGEGLLLTTESCLLGSVQARNPGLPREKIERVLGRTLGVAQVLWLPGRTDDATLAGDDTHGHVDNLARFVGPSTVAVAVAPRSAPQHAGLQANVTALERMRDARGRPLDVVPLPVPRPRAFDREPLPASYLNFYVANDVVLVPTFNDPADREALRVLERCFSDREVVGVHALDLVAGLGAIHCVTQQQPR